VLHHLRDDLVAKSGLNDTDGSLARPKTRNSGAPREFLSDVGDLVIDDFLGNLDLKILFALADVC
jgi:hypothetical protein